jgi:hypothetical protein
MPNDPFIDQLVRDLKPVQRRRAGMDAGIVVGLCIVELLLYLAMGAARPDIVAALQLPSFWWRLVSCGALALLAALTAIASFNPVASPHRGLRQLGALGALAIAAGWCVDAMHGSSLGGNSALGARLNWPEGLQCLYHMVVLSLPPILALGLLMRRGAPTEPAGTALAIGIAAAAWGAFVYVFACPDDDALYIAVWYTVGMGLITLLARGLLPLLTRW